MKKVKIMLLSLALFAVVGGALAFKAKYLQSWCTTNAYSDLGGPGGAVRYYCTHNPGTGITTTTCGPVVNNIKFDNVTPNPVLKVCTTDPNILGQCPQACDIKTSTTPDGGI